MDEDKYTYHTGYSNALLQGLKSLYEDSQLCDIVIKVGGRDFLAHKAVLAATSSYFKAMFTTGFKESQQREVNIDGNPDAFEALLEFVYTCRVDVNKVMKNMYDLFQMALYMDFKECSYSCTEVFTGFIPSGLEIKSLTVEEVCKVFFLARDHDNDDEVFDLLDVISQNFLMHKLGALKDTEVFMQNATVKFLEEFLCKEDLANEKEEKQVLELVVNWLKFNWEERQDYAPQLLQKVRLGLVSTDDIKEIIGPEIYAIPGCSELLSKVEKLRDSGKSKYTLAHQELKLFASRTSITALIATSKRESYELRYPYGISIGYYDDGWFTLQNFAPVPELTRLSLVVADGILFAVGCKNYSKDSADLHRYDAEENKWISLPSTSKDMEYSRPVYLDGFIYIIGGGLRSAQVRYDVSENRWENVQSLPVYPSRVFSVVAFKGRIFCSVLNYGSNPGFRYYKLLTYDPSQDVWQEAVVLKECDGSSSGVESVDTLGVFLRTLNSRALISIFIHNEQCYRIVIQRGNIGNETVISVTRMDLQVSDNDEVICTIKDEITQDPKPAGGLNTFRIHDEVFVYEFESHSIYKDVAFDIDFNEISSNIVMFTFDKRKVQVRC